MLAQLIHCLIHGWRTSLNFAVGGFEMKNATEMVSKAAPEVTLEGGFTW